MEKLTISKLEWRKSKDDTDWASVNYDPQARKGISCWARKSDIEKYGLLKQGDTIEVEMTEKGQYKNIVAIKDQTGKVYKWDRFGNIQEDSSAPTPTERAVETPLPTENVQPVEISHKLETELEAGSGNIIDEISGLVKIIKEQSSTLDLNQLTNIELRLAALNIDFAKRLSANNTMANQMEMDYKKKRTEKIRALQQIDPNLSDTKAKTHAEADLWQDKVELTVQQDKVKSNEVIMGGINNLLFAIKDRIKHLRP